MAKILIVDDAVFIRTKMTQMLETSGHTLLEAKDGKEAIELYRKEMPDLILMDITMPELDGISAVREIKQINPSAKIIMCSSMGQQSKIVESIEAGAIDFIIKPYKDTQMMNAINRILETQP